MHHGIGLLFCLLIAGAGQLCGSVRLELVKGRPVADGVFVNGHGPYRFLIDTATSSNHIEPDLARSIGLIATYRTDLTSSVGRIAVLGSDRVSIDLEEAHAAEQNVLFAGMDVVHQLAAGIQGILGQDFLSHFDYLLDMRGKRLDFGKRQPEGQRSAFRLANGRAAVSTNLGDLLLDSGAANVVLFGVRPEGPNSSYLRTIAGTEVVGMVYRRLVIAGRRIWSGDAVAIPNPREPGIDGLLPLSLFRTVYVSNSERYAAFQ
jgi:hypothetical protein